jgi:ELWxxDGT repeat protein
MPAGSQMYFFAAGDQDGLWVTDGTSNGTQFVKAVAGVKEDLPYIHSRPWSASLSDMVYFRSYDPTYGYELWRTNGMESGTRMVADAVQGKDLPPEDLTVFQNEVYFIRNIYQDQYTSSPYLFKANQQDQILAVSKGTASKPVILFKNALYFSGRYQVGPTDYGIEPMRITDTSSIPALFTDLAPGSSSSNPKFLGATDSWLYFSAYVGKNGVELWATDGSPQNTFLVANINPQDYGSSYPGSVMNLGSQVFFSANDGVHGSELWRYDEISRQANLVLDINSGASDSAPQLMGTLNNQMLFFAKGSDGIYDLWATDGTPDGTSLLKDVDPAVSQFNDVNGYQWLEYAFFHEALYLASYAAESGMELWRSDGTVAGTVPFLDIRPGPDNAMPKSLTACGQRLCFSANDGNHGTELWATDGTPEGTQILKDLNTTAPGSDPANFAALGGFVYFTANDDEHGTELWAINEQSASSTLVKNIHPDQLVDAAPSYLTPVSDSLFFVADDGEHGAELWKTSPLTGQTELVKDIDPGPQGSSPFALTAAGGKLYFYARASGNNWELWRSDGTPDGTVLVNELFLGATGVYRGGIMVLNNRLILYARSSSIANMQIWGWDYTTEGAPFNLLKTFLSATIFTRCNDRIFFHGGTVSQSDLWETDGTLNGTKKVLPVAGTELVNAVGAAQADVNGVLYFFADNDKGPALFRTTGSESGIVQVKVLPMLGNFWVYPIRIVNLDGVAIFEMSYAGSGDVLWRSDGTEAGTQPIAGAYTTPDGFNFRVLNHKIYFSGLDAENGSELWVSDGTSSGTTLLADIAVGSDSSSPTNLFTIGRQLYFSANDMKNGRELWVYPTIDILLSRTSFPEGDETVGILTLMDPDSSDEGVCVLLDNGGGPFILSAGRLIVTRPLDYEKDPHNFSVRVSCSDSQVSSIEKTFLLNVTDRNEGPSITNPGEQVITMSEDGDPLPFHLNLTAFDEDANTTLQWSLESAPRNGIASVDGTGFSKIINYVPSPNYAGQDEFIVQVSDGSLTATYPVNVDILAVNDPPTINPIVDLEMQENAGEQVIPLTGISAGPTNETEDVTIGVNTDRPDLFSELAIQYSGGSTGTLIILPKSNLSGTAMITITVDDGQAANRSILHTSKVMITPLNKTYMPIIIN